MDGLIPILCLLVGLTVPIGALFFIIRKGTHQLSAADAYKEVARDLGLKLDTRGIGLQGFLQQRHLWIGQVLLGTDRRSEVQGVLGFRKPLGYGLTLHSKKRKRTGGGVSSGDEEFDKLFSVNAVHIDGAKALLNQSVREATTALHDLCPAIQVTDDLIRIKLSAPERQAKRLSDLVAAMTTLADALESQRPQNAVLEDLEDVIDDWKSLAKATDLGFDPEYPTLSQSAPWGTMTVSPRWFHSEFVAEIRVYFANTADTGFRLTPQRGPSAPWLTGQDIQVRDPSFDKAFIVKGYHPEQIRKRLHAEARTLLLDLSRSSPFEISDYWMRIPNAPIDSQKLNRVIDQTRRVAETLGES